MRTILCYGDSNTWGWNPTTEDRYPYDVRWPGVLQAELGKDYRVIEEGLNGRTTVWDDPIEEHKNGKTYLLPCLESHKPIDLVVLMLGSNDLKKRFSLTAYDIAEGAGRLVSMILMSQTGLQGKAPGLLLVAPPPIGDLEKLGWEIFEGAQAKAKTLSAQFRRVSEQYGCALLDAAAFIEPSPVDGLHLEASEHHKLGQRVAQVIKEMYR